MTQTLSIIIPAFNEEKTIFHLLEQVIDVDLGGVEKELIIVNDCSWDKTQEAVEQFILKHPGQNVKFFQHATNTGKGGAIHTGIEKASGNFIIIQDADLELDPRDYKQLLTPILEGRADVVYGSRFIGSNPRRILFYWHKKGNGILTSVSNMFSNLNLTDMATCYKLFRAEIIKGIALKEKRFGFDPEVTAKIAKIPNLRIYEVGISYHARTYAEGKKIGWRDGFRALWCIVKYNLMR